MARGKLRLYLGAAPGVGKTYAMLGEARRRAARGTDVVVENPGGALRVTLDDDVATLSGPVQFVANVEWLEA